MIPVHADPTAPLATQRIQAAIDAAAAQGGGRVQLCPGLHVSGTLTLRSQVELYLEAGARLRASADPADFLQIDIAGCYGGNTGGFLIQAHDGEHITISGPGEIDGNALAYMDGWRAEPFIRKPKAWRPRGIGFTGCRHVTLRDFTFRDSASWTIHLTGCVDVLCDGLRILNRLDVPNCDGIDPDHCRDVRIIGCHIEAADDGIVLKNTQEHVRHGACENILISSCTIVSTSAAIKLGTESACDFRNVLVENCIIHSSNRGLAIQLRDQGTIENVSFSHCLVETRLFHDLYWGRGEPIYVTAIPRHDGNPAGKIRDIRFTDIRCRSENGIFIAGSPDAPIEDLLLSDVRVEMEHKSRWPVNRHDYRPTHGKEHGGLVEHPANGLFLAHVKGAHLRDVRVAWKGSPPEGAGPLVEQHHVENLRVSGLPIF